MGVQRDTSHRMISVFLLSAILLQCEAQYFANICEESSGHRCCAEEGMQGHTYWIMGNIPSTWQQLDQQCYNEGGKLLVLESRREKDCIVKYILDEYKGDPVKSFAIGLKTPENYKGVYEWKHVDNGQKLMQQHLHSKIGLLGLRQGSTVWSWTLGLQHLSMCCGRMLTVGLLYMEYVRKNNSTQSLVGA